MAMIPDRLVARFSQDVSRPSTVVTCAKVCSTVAYLCLVIGQATASTSLLALAHHVGSPHQIDGDIDIADITYSIFLIATLVLGIPSNYIIAKIGLRRASLLSGGLHLAGCLARLAVKVSPAAVLLGQAAIGASFPMSQNGAFKYCRQSFEKKTVGRAHQFAFMLSLFSGLLGLGSVGGFLLSTSLSLACANKEEKARMLVWLLVSETAFALMSCTLVFAFVRPDVERFGQDIGHKSSIDDSAGFATLAQASR